MSAISRLSLILLTALTCGCATSSVQQMQRWTMRRGGLIQGPCQDRADHALARLKVSNSIEPTVTVAVLNSDEIGAYCWGHGAIFVTRGLIDVVDDDELAAAVAHEAGHLLLGGHMPSTSALDGCRLAANGCAAEDGEVAADALGSELLRGSKVSQDALPRLLNKLAAHPATPSGCRQHLQHRVNKLLSGAPR